MERVIETEAGPEAEGMRLDQWLSKRFSYRSRNEWQRAVKNGEIRIGGVPAKASRTLRAGERIAFVPSEPIEEPPVDLHYEILHRDPQWVVLAKSGNLPCHPSGIFFKHTLWHAFKEKENLDLSVITRLDRETSGVVLGALNPKTASALTDLMMKHKICKRYLALVFGEMKQEIRAEGFLSPDPDSPVHKKRRFTFETVPDSESANTLLRPLRVKDGLTLVEALPETGRLHQIRATLCSLGFPLAGDKLYGPDPGIYLRFLKDAMTADDTRLLRLPTQALHAESICFRFENKDYEFHAPLPPWA